MTFSCFAAVQLLPLPTSYPVSPDEGENADLNKFNQRVSAQSYVTIFSQCIFHNHFCNKY